METKTSFESDNVDLILTGDLPVANDYEYAVIMRVTVVDDKLVIDYQPDGEKSLKHAFVPLDGDSRERLYRVFYPQIGYQDGTGTRLIRFNHLITKTGIFITRQVMNVGGYVEHQLIDFVFDARFKTDYEIEVNLENGYYDIPACSPDMVNDDIQE